MKIERSGDTSMVDVKSDNEGGDLQMLERVIQRGLHTFLEVGDALMTIRDNKLYRKDYRNFESYCRERWNFSRPRAYQLIGASRIVHELSTDVDEEHLPRNENQARRLAMLRTRSERLDAWREVVQRVETTGEEHHWSEALESVVKLRLESVPKQESKSKGSARNRSAKTPPQSDETEHLLCCIEQGLFERDLPRVCGLLKQLRRRLGL